MTLCLAKEIKAKHTNRGTLLFMGWVLFGRKSRVTGRDSTVPSKKKEIINMAKRTLRGKMKES